MGGEIPRRSTDSLFLWEGMLAGESAASSRAGSLCSVLSLPSHQHSSLPWTPVVYGQGGCVFSAWGGEVENICSQVSVVRADTCLIILSQFPHSTCPGIFLASYHPVSLGNCLLSPACLAGRETANGPMGEEGNWDEKERERKATECGVKEVREEEQPPLRTPGVGPCALWCHSSVP